MLARRQRNRPLALHPTASVIWVRVELTREAGIIQVVQPIQQIGSFTGQEHQLDLPWQSGEASS
jgi:hypothetical protein